MTLVPILIYHSISGDPMALIRSLAVDEHTFADHLDMVASRGLTSLTVSEFLAAADRADAKVLEQSVVITFDDGFADFASAALPALQDRGLRATLFITTGLLRDGSAAPIDGEIAQHMLAWPQLAELRALDVELGAHSHSHPHLDTLSRRHAREEIVRSKSLLEDALAAPVSTFAYPHGYSSRRVRGLVRDAGFRGACAVKNAFSADDDDRFALSRLMVRADTGPEEIGDWLDRRGAPITPRRDAPRTRAWRGYRRARALLTRRPGADPGWPQRRG